jgi:Protein of unknown function (DUF3987)
MTLGNLRSLGVRRVCPNCRRRPHDLPASQLPVSSFDPDLMPENFKAWVEDIGRRMQCPQDYVAVAAMIGAGVLIGRKIAVRPKQRDNWTEVANLWGCAVGPSGVMKSPARRVPAKLQGFGCSSRRAPCR